MKRYIALILALSLCFGLLTAQGAQGVETTENAEATPTAIAFTPMAYGDQGPLVTQIQERLTQLGYYTGKISGNYLEGTRASIRRFQKDYDLEQTGETDQATYDALMAAEYRGLKNGDDGEAVSRLQERLIELGYLNAEVTGKFRSATEGAVKAFQKQHNLDRTGQADLDTQKLLFSEQALIKGASPTPTPNPLTDLGDINDMVMVEDGSSTVDSRDETPFGKKLVRGAQGENVKLVQNRLTELGFFDGPISGYYMDQTIAAVEAFQEHNGLYPEGDMDEETWNQLLNAADVVPASATPKPSPVPTPVPYRVVVDVNNQVTTVYGRDEAGGYTDIVKQMICSTGKADSPSELGDWVTDGRRARWAYFSLYGSHAQFWTKINEDIAFHSVVYREVDYMALSVNSYNRLGRKSSHGCIRLLVSDAKWIYDNIRKGVTISIRDDLPEDQELAKALVPPPLDKKSMTPSVTPVPTAPPVYQSDGMPPQPFRRLRLESEGEDVYWLQCKLKELGYYEGTVTGAYWNGTKAAVRAFQKDHDLKADGVASVKTLEALYADILAVNTPTPVPTETPEPTPQPEYTPEPTPMEPVEMEEAVEITGQD